MHRLGLGAPIPKDFLQSTDPKARRRAVSANEALKRKIMGRGKSSSNQEVSKPRPRTSIDQLDTNNDDDEAEEGRSSLGKPKRRKVAVGKGKKEEKEYMANEDRSCTMEDQERTDEGADEKATKISSPSSTCEETTKTSSRRLVRFGTYLDVHKAEKARKKKKKKA